MSALRTFQKLYLYFLMMFSFYFVAFYRWRKCRWTSQVECCCQKAAFQGKVCWSAWGETITVLRGLPPHQPASNPWAPAAHLAPASQWLPPSPWLVCPPLTQQGYTFWRWCVPLRVPPFGAIGEQRRDMLPHTFPFLEFIRIPQCFWS